MSYTIVMSVALLVVTQAAPRPAAHREAAIGAASLLEPTPIRLDFENRTLPEIITLLNAQSTISVMMPPEPTAPVPGDAARPTPPPPTRQFSLHEPEPVPFWKAVDRVCGIVQRWPGIAVQLDPSIPPPANALAPLELDPKVVLVPASRDRGFVCTDGAFRVVVARLFVGRDIRFAPALFPQPRSEISSLDRPGDETVFSADLIIMIEPRLKFVRLGDPTLGEATDDQGHNLIATGSGRQPLKDRQALIPSDAAAITVPFSLNYPSDHGTRITRLRGSMPVEVSSRKAGSQSVAATVTFNFADIPMP